MRTNTTFLKTFAATATIGLTALLSSPAFAIPEEGTERVSEAQARRIALTNYPGRVMDCAKLQMEDGSTRYQVEIASGVLHRTVHVDAADGEIEKVRFFSANGPGWVAYNNVPGPEELGEDYRAMAWDADSVSQTMANAAEAISLAYGEMNASDELVDKNLGAALAQIDHSDGREANADDATLYDSSANNEVGETTAFVRSREVEGEPSLYDVMETAAQPDTMGMMLSQEEAMCLVQSYYPGEVVWQQGPVMLDGQMVYAVAIRDNDTERTFLIPADTDMSLINNAP